jgi:NitT/TauT family transport system substrate-binding protein
MTIARTSGPASALLFIADDQGFLKQNGLEVEIRTFPSSADAVNALIAGEIVGAQPSAQIVNSLIGRNVDVKVLAVVSRNPRDMKVVGTSDISKPADLKGKKVAVVAGSASEFLMTRYLASGGLTLNDVEVVKADPPEIVAVMERGEAQAFALWEPFPANALKVMGTRGKVLAHSNELGYQGTLFQIMSGKFLREQPEGAVRLLKAYAQAEQFLKTNPEKSLEIIARAARLEVAAAKPLVEAGDFRLVADQGMLDELKLLGQWMYEIGQLKEIPDYRKIIDTSFLQQADPGRVTLKL